MGGDLANVVGKYRLEIEGQQALEGKYIEVWTRGAAAWSGLQKARPKHPSNVIGLASLAAVSWEGRRAKEFANPLPCCLSHSGSISRNGMGQPPYQLGVGTWSYH